MSKNTTPRAPRAPRVNAVSKAVVDTLAPLRNLGFESADAVYEGLFQADRQGALATRASIYSAIMGWLWKEQCNFSTATDESLSAKRSSLKHIVNATGCMTEAGRFELAVASLDWPAMSHGSALARIREGMTVGKDKAGKETRKIDTKAVAKAVVKAEAVKQAKKAEKKAEAVKQVQAKTPDVKVDDKAKTVKSEAYVVSQALMLLFDKAKYEKGTTPPDGDMAMLKNIINGIIKNIVN
jgi:hypothetical protein